MKRIGIDWLLWFFVFIFSFTAAGWINEYRKTLEQQEHIEVQHERCFNHLERIEKQVNKIDDLLDIK